MSFGASCPDEEKKGGAEFPVLALLALELAAGVSEAATAGPRHPVAFGEVTAEIEESSEKEAVSLGPAVLGHLR